MSQPCTACGSSNADGQKFCAQCGQQLSPAPSCSCGAALPSGARFCTSCGKTVGAATVPRPGPVVDGEWARAPGEFVRRVSGDELRNVFAGLVPGVDLDGFVRGSLVGRLVDALLTRTIRVPMGSVGVLMRDGACVRVLPPGEQTTANLWKEVLAGRGAEPIAEHVLGIERVALYLVDLRPIPIGFSVEAPRADGGLTSVHVQALVAPGNTRDALTALVTEVVRDQASLASAELHGRVRADLEQAVRDALRARPGDLPAAEREARRTLESRALARTGLRLELVLAPRSTVHRLDVALSDALLTSDAKALELDVVVSVQADKPPALPTDALLAAARRFLRDRAAADVLAEGGFAALEQALSEALTGPLAQAGHRLLSIDLVDVRSPGAAWTLGARAAMAKATAELAVGREWLTVRDDERALEALTQAAVLKQQQQGRDHAFTARQAKIDDARRHADLDAAERELRQKARAADHGDALTGDAQRHERERVAESQRAALERDRMALDSDRARRAAEDEAHKDKLKRESRLEELRGMAALDADIADREQRHRVEVMAKLEGKTEAQILAMQATDLASKEHGAAFAEALGKLGDGDAARRERERADARLDAKDERMMRLVEKALTPGVRADSCTRCGAILQPAAQFCGGCGTARPR